MRGPLKIPMTFPQACKPKPMPVGPAGAQGLGAGSIQQRTNGVNINGVTAISMFFDRRYFCRDPISVDPISPHRQSPY